MLADKFGTREIFLVARKIGEHEICGLKSVYVISMQDNFMREVEGVFMMHLFNVCVGVYFRAFFKYILFVATLRCDYLLYLLVHLFVQEMFVHSFMLLIFVHLFMQLRFVQLFMQEMFVHLFIMHTFVHLFMHLFVHLFMHSEVWKNARCCSRTC